MPHRLSCESTISPGSTTPTSAARSREGRDYADLAALGVKTIINLTSDEDVASRRTAAVESHGMRYVHIPMSTRRAPTEKELATFLQWSAMRPASRSTCTASAANIAPA